jgi:hypothetical protein
MSDAIENKYMEIVFEFQTWLMEGLGDYRYDIEVEEANNYFRDHQFTDEEKKVLSMCWMVLGRIVEKIR